MGERGRFRISDFEFRIFGSRDGCPTNAHECLVGHASRVPCAAEVSETFGQRLLVRGACGGGAIFNIVGRTDLHVGGALRAINVEGGSSREQRADTCTPTGRDDHTPQVNPLGQLGAEGQELSELDEPLAKVESTRSTLVLSHFAQWTSALSAPTG